MDGLRAQTFDREYTSSRNGRPWATLFISICLLLLIPANIVMFSTTDEGLRDKSVLLVVKITILAYLLFAFELFMFIALLFSPLLIIVVFIVLLSPTALHWNWAFWMIVYPIAAIFGIIGVAIAAISLYFLRALLIWIIRAIVSTTILCFPLMVHYLTFQYFIIRPPRYRDTQYAQSSLGSDLCSNCRSVLLNSKLLLGTSICLTRTEEWHPFYSTLEDMKHSWLGCTLCEALLVPRSNEEGHTALAYSNHNYGTISMPLESLEEGNLFVSIRLHEDSSFFREFGLAFILQLRTASTLISKELTVMEGKFHLLHLVNRESMADLI
jgi:hypothetical protein